MNKHLILICIFCLLFIRVKDLQGQNINKKKPKVFVWEFTTHKYQMNELTQFLTQDFEEMLSISNRVTVLQRRRFDKLLEIIKTEKGILNVQNIPKIMLDTLKFCQANAVFFGELREDIESKQRKVIVTLQKFNGEIVAVRSISVDPLDLRNSDKRIEAMKNLVEMFIHPSSASQKEEGEGKVNRIIQFFLSPIPFAYESYTKKSAMYRKAFAGIATVGIGSSIYSYFYNQNEIDKYETRKNSQIIDQMTKEYFDNAYKYYKINRISLAIYGLYVAHNLIDSIAGAGSTSEANRMSKLNKTYFLVSNENNAFKIHFIYRF